MFQRIIFVKLSFIIKKRIQTEGAEQFRQKEVKNSDRKKGRIQTKG